MSAAEERGYRRPNTQNPHQNSSNPQRQNSAFTAGPGRRGGGVGGGARGGNNNNNNNSNNVATAAQRPGLNSNVFPTAATITPTTRTPDSPSFLSQDEHVPLKGFNAQEVQNILSKGVDLKAPVYKPEAQAQTHTQTSQPQQQTKSAPWGAKPGSMANGRDFWLELRKQVATLQQTGGVSQGG